jgi:pimeloyl-ACP methyl ester carboxylesterase
VQTSSYLSSNRNIGANAEKRLALAVGRWPTMAGSVIEQMKVIGPLTDPPPFGGKAEDAFDVVIPSLPGHGFSGKPSATAWDVR